MLKFLIKMYEHVIMIITNTYSPQLLMIGFAVLFFVYYNICVNFNPKVFFFIICIVAGTIWLYYQNQLQEKKQNENIDTFTRKVETDMVHDFEIPDNRVYYVHKLPRSVRFVKATSECKMFLHNLRFLNIYDQPLYYKIVAYLENFLKIHYKMMLGKYEFRIYFATLKDVRDELLNTLKTIYFNIPRHSQIFDIPDIDAYVDKQIAFIQALTSNYLKIIYHKYASNSPVTYRAPFEHDSLKSALYHTF